MMVIVVVAHLTELCVYGAGAAPTWSGAPAGLQRSFPGRGGEAFLLYCS